MSTVPSLLVVEDELNVGSTLVERLERESFSVVWAKNAAQAENAIVGRAFDLALVDVGLPDGSGFDVARSIRKTEPRTAIIFLTAWGDPEHRVQGLELGAEDYVVKPFHLKELLLRIKNGLRRSEILTHDPAEPSEGVTVGLARVRFRKFEIESGGAIHALTHKECALLKLLYDRRGEAVSRDEILDTVWSKDEFPSPRTVDNFVLRFRKLIEPEAETPKHILSVRGVGYRLVVGGALQ